MNPFIIMKSLGEYLKKERELRGVTIEEIASITRISSRFIHALENDDFKNLPSEVFVKGFLRAYAKCVGIDPNEVISIYTNIRKADEKPETKKEISPPIKFNNTSIITLTSIIALILITLGGIFYYKNGSKNIAKPILNELPELKTAIEEQPKENSEPKEELPLVQTEKAIDEIEQKPITDQHTEETVKTIPAIPNENIAKSDESVEKKQEPLKLTLTALETVWFSIVIDDSETREAILQPNEKMIFTAKEKFSLTTGNTTGTDVMLDGIKISLPTTRSNVLKNHILTRQ